MSDVDPMRSFVHEGTELYLDACQALRDYRRKVYNLCKKALEHHRETVEVAFGVSWTIDGIKEFSYPDRLDDSLWEDDCASIWVRALCTGGYEFWLGLYWERGEEGTVSASAQVSVNSNSAPAFDRLWRTVSPLAAGKLQEDSSEWGVYSSVPITLGDEHSIASGLEDALRIWTAALGSGGLKSVVSKNTKKV
jgi:hypothetical protein